MTPRARKPRGRAGGRRKKPAKAALSHSITFNVTEAQYGEIAAFAAEHLMNLSAYCRMRTTEYPIERN